MDNCRDDCLSTSVIWRLHREGLGACKGVCSGQAATARNQERASRGSDIGLQELIDGELCPLYAVFPRALWPCWPCSWRGRSTSRHPCQQDLGEWSTALGAVRWTASSHLPWGTLVPVSSQSQGQKGWAGSFSASRKHLWTHLRKRPSGARLAFPICSQRKGNGRKFYPPRV